MHIVWNGQDSSRCDWLMEMMRRLTYRVKPPLKGDVERSLIAPDIARRTTIGRARPRQAAYHVLARVLHKVPARSRYSIKRADTADKQAHVRELGS